LLWRQGYDVITATSRAAGLAALAGEPIDLVISDLRLPDGDGLDVIRAATSARHPMPVIVVTGYPSDEDPARGPRGWGHDVSCQALRGCDAPGGDPLYRGWDGDAGDVTHGRNHREVTVPIS
jgi:CheY-like chemotaxis protein